MSNISFVGHYLLIILIWQVGGDNLKAEIEHLISFFQSLGEECPCCSLMLSNPGITAHLDLKKKKKKKKKKWRKKS